MSSVSKAFLSYVHEDSEFAERIARNFQRNGIGIWKDKEELAGGVRWKTAIKEAIRSGTYFISLHSSNRSSKLITYANEELALAIEELRKRPTSTRWLIPVRVDDCDIDDRPIGAGETYMDLHIHDLRSFDAGILSLLGSLGVENPALAEEKSSARRDEFVAPQGSPFNAIHAIEELSKLPAGETVPSEALAVAFGSATISDLSKLKLIASGPRGYWQLAAPIDDPKLALAIAIANIPAFQVVVSELKKNFGYSGFQLGATISNYLGREWAKASCQRNGAAYKKWAVVLYPNFALPKVGEKSYIQARSVATRPLKKGRASYFTPDIILEMAKLKKAGKNAAQIGRTLGFTPQAVYRWRNENPEKWGQL